MQNEKKSTFFGGAAVLMVGSVLVKLIGAVYKIPLANILSDEAYVDFNFAYSIYNLFLTIATAGLPVALSKMVSEANTLGRQNQVDRVFSLASKVFLFMGILSFGFMSLGAGWLTGKLKNPSAVWCVLCLSPSVLCVCVMSAFRGYYQGHSNMVPTAVSQVIESFGKLVFGLALALLVLNSFIGPETYLQRMAAAGAILGVSIGSIIALVYIILHYLKDHKRHKERAPYSDTPDSDRAILERLLDLAIPITLGSAAISIATLADNWQIMYLLEKMYIARPNLIAQEASEQWLIAGGVAPPLFMAQGLKGIYDKCMAIYNLPSQLMVAITASVIPAVSACLARRDTISASKTSESALRIGVIMAFPMGFGLFALGGPIVQLLYPSMDVSIGGPIMSVLGLAAIFVCIMSLCCSILQAHGHVLAPVVATLVGTLVKLVVNHVLVGIPEVNIFGASVGSLCGFAVVAVLDMYLIHRVVPDPPHFLRALAKPLLASVVMGAAAWSVCGLASRFVGVRIGCLVGIAAGVAVYAVLVVVLKVFSKDDLSLMPKGDKIAKILRIS